jgi:glycerophosphoryl diester phosphodiesterase
MSIAAGRQITHRESIERFKSFGGKFTPDMEAAVSKMPYEGFTQEALRPGLN